jgi:signal transduction histidine kinase
LSKEIGVIMSIESYDPINNIPYYLFVIAALLVLATYTWQFRKVPGAKAQVYGQICKGVLLLSLIMLSISSQLSDKIFWVQLLQAASILSPCFWLMLVSQLSNQEKKIPLLVRHGLYGMSGIIFLMSLSNPWHGLYYRDSWLDGKTLKCIRGSLFLLKPVVAYLLCAITLALSVRWVIITRGLRRRQALWFTLAGLISVVGILLEFVLKLKNINPLPLSFLLSGLLTTWGFYRWQVYNIIPLAQEVAIRNMVDGLLVIDENGYIADMNDVAKKILVGLPVVIGGKFVELLAVYPELAKVGNQLGVHILEVAREISGEKFYYQWSLTSLQTSEHVLGKVLLIKDITCQKRQQERVLEQQKALAIVEERQSLAREVHDDLCQVLGYINLQSQAVRKAATNGQTDVIVSGLNRMIDATRHAYDDAREYIRGVQTTKLQTEGLVSALQNYVTWVRQEYALDITLDIPKEFEQQNMNASAELQLLRIIQEALANIRKHAKASHCSLKLRLDDTVIRVIVTDDGEGFDIDGCSDGAGFGLTTMRERAEKAGGMLKIKSVLGQGTKIVIEIPRIAS